MNSTIVREWLDHVEADLDVAWSCGRGPRARLDRAAYLVQQAAEKLVKAALVSAELDPPRLSMLADLTPYATSFRYPTPQEPLPFPSLEWIDGRIAEIAGLKADFERWLEAREGAP